MVVGCARSAGSPGVTEEFLEPISLAAPARDGAALPRVVTFRV